VRPGGIRKGSSLRYGGTAYAREGLPVRFSEFLSWGAELMQVEEGRHFRFDIEAHPYLILWDTLAIVQTEPSLINLDDFQIGETVRRVWPTRIAFVADTAL